MSSNTVISVENLSKMYRLGRVNSGSFGHDVKRWWANVRGKEDPFSMVASENDRTQKGNGSEYVWALKDVSFDVQKGDVLGIVGRNGAGKSTLLKMLTRVTLPTTGSIKAKGRIASLLEVGTGFHPDLTGRENIFLNGAILGMSKTEIKKKFDEIVDFSGVERYIDTPVKRYSSGMYVRLAFGVAAHLESEILIIDEVLAVGDTEFQKKCLGKMGDVANKEGRTVLFVSHNTAAVIQLCNKAVYMENGKLLKYDNTDIIINEYVRKGQVEKCYEDWNGKGVFFDEYGIKLQNARLKKQNEETSDLYLLNQEIYVELNYILEKSLKFNFSITVKSESDQIVYVSPSISETIYNSVIEKGKYNVNLKLPANLLNSGKYKIDVLLVNDRFQLIHCFEDLLMFNISEEGFESFGFLGKWSGVVRPTTIWETRLQ